MTTHAARFIRQRYTRQGLWSLFLVCAFPLHLWTLLMAFRDISWLTERTNARDAIGVVSYGMLFAFAESVVVFGLVALLGFFTPPRWTPQRRIAFLSLLLLITAGWAMIAQLLFMWNVSLPAWAVDFLRGSSHPFRILYAGSLALVAPTVVLPVYAFIRSRKAAGFMQNLIERLSLLAAFYLFLDVLAIVVIIFRNLG